MIKSDVYQPTDCIFCHRKPLSREHYWPQWATRLFPMGQGNVRLYSTLNQKIVQLDGGQEKIPATTTNINRKIKKSEKDHYVRCVCNKCNNTWMSDIEREAKKIILPMVFEGLVQLSCDQVRILRSWATLRIMITEFPQPETAACMPFEYEDFYLHKSPPPHWFFWIGRSTQFSSPWRTQNAMFIPSTKHWSETQEEFPIIGRMNTKFTRLQIGNLLVCCFSSNTLFYNPIEIPHSPFFREMEDAPKSITLPAILLPAENAEIVGRTFVAKLQRWWQEAMTED